MARTLPTSPSGVVGLSPIDAYTETDKRPVGYFETNLAGTLNTYMTTVEVVTNCNIVTLGMVQGLNVTVTLGSSSSRGSTACGIYAKVDLGAAESSMAGRTSVIEARLDIGASSGTTGAISCLCLDWSNKSTYPGEIGGAYILCRDRSTGVQRQNKLFQFSDITPAITDPNALFSTDTSPAITHALRFWVGSTPYWIMCSDAAPA